MNKFSKTYSKTKEDKIIVEISTYGMDFWNNKLKTLNKMINEAKDDFQFIGDEDIEVHTVQNHLIIKFMSQQKRIPEDYLEATEDIILTDFNKLQAEQEQLREHIEGNGI